MEWCEFNGSTFTRIDDPTDDAISDWDESLAAIGWDTFIPGHFPSEYSTFWFSVVKSGQRHGALVQINDPIGGFGQVICTSLPAFLKFMAEYVRPMCEIGNSERIHEILSLVEESVLDPEVGIDSVRQAARRSEAWRRSASAYRDELIRKQNKSNSPE